MSVWIFIYFSIVDHNCPLNFLAISFPSGELSLVSDFYSVMVEFGIDSFGNSLQSLGVDLFYNVESTNFIIIKLY